MKPILAVFKSFLSAGALVIMLVVAVYAAGPAKSGGNFEMLIDATDAGGSPVPGYQDGGTQLLMSLGESGGMQTITGASGFYELQSGYFGQDLLPPSAIQTFVISNLNLDGAISLSWNATGDNMSVDHFMPGTRIFIASTTASAQAQDSAYWDTRRQAADIVIATGPVVNNQVTQINIADLRETTYYFRIWTLDQAANWSDISTGATIYARIAPGRIASLFALPGDYGRTVKLGWNSSGDDRYSDTIVNGAYKIQYASDYGVEWSTAAAQITFSTTTAPSASQARVASGLSPGTTYFFRVWTADDDMHWSTISNGATVYAQPVYISVSLNTDHYDYGSLDTGISSVSASSITVFNTGNVNQKYSLYADHAENWICTTAPGDNQFSLQGALHGVRPTAGEFDGQDNLLSLAPVAASSTTFTIDGSQQGGEVPPYGVAFTSQERNLWFKFNTPLATSTSVQQTIPFTVIAEEADDWWGKNP